MTPADRQSILAVLKSELEFIEKGGYKTPSAAGPAPAPTIFADSLTCLNYGYPYRTHPCTECPLMEFVPESARTAAMPCHHIPLDPAGRTVEAMEGMENTSGMQEAVKNWLRQTISRIESQLPA
ncbi:MAG TPA: hypothetical protein VFC10_07745 [Terriglobia bacterium]|jgi:hypothetical protein|nr:hypothetical protein [Terriglobia bacterium]